MGGMITTNPRDILQKKSIVSENEKDFSEKLTSFFYPIYYTTQPLSSEERLKAIQSFKIISSNQAEEFYRMKKADPVNVTCQSPMEFFGNRFYKRLLEIHPTCQPLFGKSTMKQGTLLYRMMSFAINELEEADAEKFQKTFQMLAHSHNRIGVHAAECKLFLISINLADENLDGVFGEVLFWTLRLTLGREIYDSTTHNAWIKLYSRMLSIIIPIAVKYEVEHKKSMQVADAKRIEQINASSLVTSTISHSSTKQLEQTVIGSCSTSNHGSNHIIPNFSSHSINE